MTAPQVTIWLVTFEVQAPGLPLNPHLDHDLSFFIPSPLAGPDVLPSEDAAANAFNFHAATRNEYNRLRDAYGMLVYAYREAAQRLRAGRPHRHLPARLLPTTLSRPRSPATS